MIVIMVEISVLHRPDVDSVYAAIRAYEVSSRGPSSGLVEKNVTSLILHGNALASVEGARELPNLKTLNASANDIKEVDAARQLPSSIESLNLATNSLRIVDFGNSHLPKLVSINLAYNKINRIAGLEGLVRLARLDLRGNRLAEVEHVGTLPKSLQSLWMQSPMGDHPNEACASDDYAVAVHRAAPWLEQLDGKPFLVPAIELAGGPPPRPTPNRDGGAVALPHFEKARERFGRRLASVEREMRFEELENKVAILQTEIEKRQRAGDVVEHPVRGEKGENSKDGDRGRAGDARVDNPWAPEHQQNQSKKTFIHTRIVRERKQRAGAKMDASKLVALLQSQVKRLRKELEAERERAHSPLTTSGTQCDPPPMRSALAQTDKKEEKVTLQAQTQTLAQTSKEEIDLKVEVAVLQSRLAAAIGDLELAKKEKREVEESRQREIDSEMEVALEFTASRTKAAVEMRILRDAERAARDALDEYRAKFRRADEQLREVRNAFVHFEQEMDVCRKEKQKAVKARDAMQRRLEESEAASRATQTQLSLRSADLEAELCRERSEAEELRRLMEILKHEAAAARQESEDVATKKDAASAAAERMGKEIVHLQAENAAFRERLMHRKAREKELEAAFEKALRESSTDAEEKLSKVKSAFNDASSQLSESKRSLDAMRAKYSKTDAEREDLARVVSRQRQRIDDLRSELELQGEILIARQSDTARQLDAANEKLEEVSSKLTNAESTRADEVRALRSRLDPAEAELLKLKSYISGLEHDASNAAADAAARAEKLSRQLADKKAALSVKNAMLEDQNQTIAALKLKIENQVGDVELKEKLEYAEGRIAEEMAAREELEAASESQERLLDNLEEMLADAKEEITALKSDLLRKDEAVALVEKELEEFRQEFRRLNDDKGESLARAEKEIKQLKERYDGCCKVREQTEEEMGDIKDKLVAAEDSHAKTLERASELEVVVGGLRDELRSEKAKRATTEAEMRVVVALLDEERTKSQVRVKQLGALFQDFSSTSSYNG